MENIEQPVTLGDGAQLPEEQGSIMGKFKDATSLSKAYANLQAEFTRKSQRLAELEKQLSGSEQPSEHEDIAPQSQSKEVQNEPPASEQNMVGENDCRNPNISQNDDFDAILSKKLLQFAENQPEVIGMLGQIKDELLAQKSLIDLDDGISIAYRLADAKQKVKPADLLEDNEYISKYVLTNSHVQQMVVDNYIKSLANGGGPKVIAGGNEVVVTPNTNRPKTFAEANKIFSKMLEK